MVSPSNQTRGVTLRRAQGDTSTFDCSPLHLYQHVLPPRSQKSHWQSRGPHVVPKNYEDKFYGRTTLDRTRGCSVSYSGRTRSCATSQLRHQPNMLPVIRVDLSLPSPSHTS